ncbi:MAG TPA: hypothetical protein VJX71_26795 [Methylomirabilota bacterium]|nr:hypothetical protein [Methylomirabilota bacterium]
MSEPETSRAPEAIRAEVETMLALVRDRYGSRLSPDELAGVRTAIEGIVQAAHALRAVRLGNGEEPGQAFGAYRAEP